MGEAGIFASYFPLRLFLNRRKLRIVATDRFLNHARTKNTYLKYEFKLNNKIDIFIV